MGRNRTSEIWKISDEEFTNLVKFSTTIRQILDKFGLENKGNNSYTVKKRWKELNLDVSHIRLGIGSNKGRTFLHRTRTTDDLFKNVLIKDSTLGRFHVKKYIIKHNLIPYKCECGNEGEWNGKKLSLQLEHKNGIPNDNRLENLSFLCPNCHSQTDTFAGKRHKKPVVEKVYKSKEQLDAIYISMRKVKDRPSKEELSKMVEEIPATSIGYKYGVSSSAVKKWCKSYGIETKPRGFWAK